MLGPAAITTALADLGADVIKIEPPSGDYVRRMTWPIVEGVSLMHLHVNRGKRSIAIDLKSPEGIAVFEALVETADVVVEAMRPGGLARRGLGYERLRELNPRIVFCTISGYGATGPYRNLASHGIAYDAWAGIFEPEIDDAGYPSIPNHVSIGINAGPLFGALGILAGVIQARATGEGAEMEVAQSDAAAAFDWYREESYRAYERPRSEVTGNAFFPHPATACNGAAWPRAFHTMCMISCAGNTVHIVSGAGARALTTVPSGAITRTERNVPSLRGRLESKNDAIPA